MEPINEGNRALLALKVVQDHLALVTQYQAQQLRYDHEYQLLRDTELRFDSPLEVVFFMWWKAINEDLHAFPAELRLQQEIIVDGASYRLDFLIEPAWLQVKKAITDGHIAWTPIAVEVDGHTFHERTREQVALRDRRDRALQQAGYHVFHFSWSELTQQPARAVEEVHAFVSARIQRAYSQFVALDPKPTCLACGRELATAG